MKTVLSSRAWEICQQAARSSIATAGSATRGTCSTTGSLSSITPRTRSYTSYYLVPKAQHCWSPQGEEAADAEKSGVCEDLEDL